MWKILRLLLLALLVVVVAGGVLLFYLLADADRFKPQLEALIAEQTGVSLRIEGDLGWRLWPPVSLSAADLRADYEGQAWQVGGLKLQLDALPLLSDPAQWRIRALTLEDVTVRKRDDVLEVRRARLTDLTPGQPARFSAELSYRSAARPAAPAAAPVAAPVVAPAPLPAALPAVLPVTLRGQVSINPDTLELSLQDTHLTTPVTEGTCDLHVSPVPDPASAPPSGPDHLIPVGLFRAYDWSGQCLLDWLLVHDQRFEEVPARLRNKAGDSHFDVSVPDFFSGRAELALAVDARRSPLRWTLTPSLTEVDSRDLLNWLDQRLQWAAPIAYGGTLRFTGNTSEALLASLSGETRFDGGQGRIDIADIKSELVSLAEMFNEADRMRSWPDVWEYQHFAGDWRIDRQHHVLDFALDNLTVNAEGDYQPQHDRLDMRAELVFGNDPALPVFPVNPLLFDLPIPLRCKGSLKQPSCRLDAHAARRLVADALAGGGDSDLRARIEKTIDQRVPEQYRDAARSLLDALGRGSRQAEDD